jgi:hypothetical protein
MKNFLLALGFFTALSTAILVACEKSELTPTVNQTSEPMMMARRGNGNGGGGGNGGTTTPATTSTSAQDSILNACGMSRDSVNAGGFIYPTIQLTNLRSRHETRYSYSSSGTPYAYDIVIIEWDNPVVLPNGATPQYSLLVSPCPTQISCGYTNGLLCTQVAYGITTNRIIVTPGMVGFYPNPSTYTAFIGIFANPTQCNYVSQQFTFEPNRILPQ